MPQSLSQRLQLKPGRKVRLVNAPKGYPARLGELPEGVTLLKSAAQPADVIQVFVANRKELEAQLEKLKKALAPGGMIWVTYYKGTSKHETDINRDSVNAYAQALGLAGVALVSVDDNWSAMRFKVVK